jgi:hypothetical protein
MVESQLIADAASEARVTLRLMLRAKQAKFRLGAASHLLKSRDTDRATESRADAEQTVSQEFQMQFEQVQAMSQEEIERGIDQFIRRERDEPVSDGAGI